VIRRHHDEKAEAPQPEEVLVLWQARHEPNGERMQVTGTSAEDPKSSDLTGELRKLLVSGLGIDGINLRVAEQDGWVLLHIMAVSTRSLGLMLAKLSDPTELDDPGSLSCRITPGDVRRRPDQWQYELIPGRYPTDRTIVFSVKIRVPRADLSEVVRRLRQRH
jgi:hypothetical protein